MSPSIGFNFTEPGPNSTYECKTDCHWIFYFVTLYETGTANKVNLYSAVPDKQQLSGQKDTKKGLFPRIQQLIKSLQLEIIIHL